MDDLIASVTQQQLAPAKPDEPSIKDKKKKDKDKNSRMIYSDNEISPEEKFGRLSKNAVA